jgi:hypothetical protein
MAQPTAQTIACPKCGTAVENLVEVDTGMKLALQTQGMTNIPAKVCISCYNSMTGQVSQGVRLRLEAQSKEKNRHVMWKSRVNLVKNARQMMQQKAYSEAAISYEKYIRVLEMSYDLKPGMLTPDLFGKSSRSKELTVVATAYWDLFRIYDTNPKYRNRMELAGRKLSEFLPYSPIYPDVIKKAQIFVGSAKNNDLVRTFLSETKTSATKCFIATAAFENPHHPVVEDFRNFRDEVLVNTHAGRIFIKIYYRVSPTLAAALDLLSFAKAPVRAGLRLFHKFLISPK